MTNRSGGRLGPRHFPFVIFHWSFVIDDFRTTAGLEDLKLQSLSAKRPRFPPQRLCRCSAMDRLRMYNATFVRKTRVHRKFWRNEGSFPRKPPLRGDGQTDRE